VIARLLHPRYWGVHAVAVLLVAAAGWLGAWQADAWQARRTAEATDLTRVAPEPLADVLGPDDPFPGDRIGQPVEARGAWLPEQTVYVEGRTGGESEQDGVWVVTPLLVDGPADPDDSDAALLVVRGWAPAPDAAPPAPSGTGDVVAWLQPSDVSTEGDPDPGDAVLPALRVADVLQRLDVDLYGGYAVVTDDRVEQGLGPATLEQLPPTSRFTAIRNLLYALEWWVFGLFAAFIWWRYVRDQDLAHQAQDEAGHDAGHDAVRSDA
jgi:surfeit locus 1 family protein